MIPPFDTVDIEMIQTYATHAALLLQLSRSRRDNEYLRRVDDRAGTGSRTRIGLQAGVDDTDAIIRAIRAAVFALRPDPIE